MKNRVLIVEDEVELMNSLKCKLEEEGFEVFSCTDGARALELIREVPFSCMIVDQLLKGTTGAELIERVRADKTCPNHSAPVLMISAHVNRELIRRLDRSIQGVLEKPFERSALAEKVKSLCFPAGDRLGDELIDGL